MASAPPAQPQKTGQRNGLSIMPRNAYTVPPISTKPMASKILLTLSENFEKIYCLFMLDLRGQIPHYCSRHARNGNDLFNSQKPSKHNTVLCADGRRNSCNFVRVIQRQKTSAKCKEKKTIDQDQRTLRCHGIACKIPDTACPLM